MNLNKIKMTMATGMLAASMILPGMTAFAAVDSSKILASDANIIKKEIVIPAGASYSNDTFKFLIEQENEKEDSGVTANLNTVALGTKDDSDNKYYITLNGSSSTTASATNVYDSTADTWTQTLTAGIDLSGITNTGVYTYKISEVKDTNSSKSKEIWSYDGTSYILRVYVSRATNGTLTKTMTIIDSTKTDDSDKATAASFTNKMTKRGGSDGKTPGGDADDGEASLIIKKAVSDTKYEPANQEYEFTVTFTENSLNTAANGLEPNTYSYKVYNSDGTEDTAKADSITGLTGTIKLRNGQYVKFDDLYAGTRVTVKEAYVKNLDSVSVAIVSNGDTGSASFSNVSSTTDLTVNKVSTTQEKTGILIGEKNNSVTYTNTYKDVTETGVVTNVAPYITLVVVAVAAVAAYMGLKSRIAR